MVTDEMKARAEQARRDGHIVFDVEGGPVRLGGLLSLVQDIFPNHTLDQLAITQAEEDKFVIAAETHIRTMAN
jgi:hypothetical protein